MQSASVTHITIHLVDWPTDHPEFFGTR